MWRILTSLFLFLSLAVTVWMTYELGLLSPTLGVAADQKETSIESLHRSLEGRGKDLDAREADLIKRERALQDKEAVLTQQIDRYEKIIRELRVKISDLEIAKDSRVDYLRQVYEKMEPKKASHILEGLDEGLAAQILSGMKQERAADILSRMTSPHARTVTEKLLGKRGVASSPAKKVNEVNTSEPKGGEQ